MKELSKQNYLNRTLSEKPNSSINTSYLMSNIFSKLLVKKKLLIEIGVLGGGSLFMERLFLVQMQEY